jgi:hypothetical protein
LRNRTKIRGGTLRRAIGLCAALTIALPIAARAIQPSVATLDSRVRAEGSRLDVATAIGKTLFVHVWPAQILKVGADSAGTDIVVGLHLSGVKFHSPMTKPDFADEIASLTRACFGANPHVVEVDVWASVPLEVGKDVVVSGDLAKPTTRAVFSASILRSEANSSLRRRILTDSDVFWDEDWVNTLFKESP